METKANIQFYDMFSRYTEQIFPIDSNDVLRQRWEKVENFFKRNNVHKILDVACGVGRNAIILTQLGYKVMGIDINKKSIEAAKELSAKRNLNIIWIVSDMKKLGSLHLEGEFDLVMCVGNSIAYMMTKRDLKLTLKGMYRALRDDGIILIDNRNFGKILKNWEEERYVYMGIVEDANGKHALVMVRDKGPKNNQMTFNFIKIPIDGKSRRLEVYPTIYRTLTNKELSATLVEVGFKNLKIFGDLEFNPYDENKNKLIYFVAKK